MVENDFNAPARAEKFFSDVNTLMDSKSGIEKFDLRNQLVAEWQNLGCDERKQVGKELERKSDGVKGDVSLKAKFDYKDGEVKTLEFSKLVERQNRGMSMVLFHKITETIHNPLDVCKKPDDK